MPVKIEEVGEWVEVEVSSDVEAGDSCDCETDLEELGSWWV